VSAEIPATTRIEGDAAARDAARPSWLASVRTDAILMLLLFTAAIIPRAAWTAYNDRAPRELNDPLFYNLFGDLMAQGHGYARITGEKFAYYPVGYPATLAGLKKAGDIFGWGNSIFSAKMMNGMFGAITVLLLYLLATRVFDRRVGITAGLLLAIFPSQVYYAGTILSEAEFTMLFVAGLLVLLWHPWTRDGMSWQRLLTTGVIFSAATMVRGILLVFPLVLLAMWLPYLHSKRRAGEQALIVFAGILVFVVPWSVRNTMVFGQLTGPSTNLGDDLCIGNAIGANGRFLLSGKCFEGYEGLSFQEVEVRRNSDGVKTAIADVINSPARMPALIGQKAYWLLHRDDDGLFAAESYGNDKFIGLYRREVLGYAANSIYYAVGSVAILGALWFAFAADLRRGFLMLTLLYLLAIPLVFFGDPRFHFPAIPLIVLVAASTMMAIWDCRGRPLPAMEGIDARVR
jgi:4-amino-4-deoxy-L-arabinose transferase-like glycosyltransferase